MRKTIAGAIALVCIVALSAIGAVVFTAPASEPQPNLGTTSNPGHGQARPDNPLLPGAPSEGDRDDYSGDGVNPLVGNSKSDLHEQESAEQPSFDEAFVSEFNRLATSRQWEDLEKHIRKSIHDASELSAFMPVLLGCLLSVEDQIGYYPVGRGVQTGMYQRQDLKEHGDLLAEHFMRTDSPVLQISLAAAVAAANFENHNNSHISRHVESLLNSRKDATSRLSAAEKSKYTIGLLAAHLRLARSVLESIEFVESLRPTGLTDAQLRWFWSDCSSQFRAKRYFPGDVERIVGYLIAHTDESIRAKNGSEKEIKRLTEIWVSLRERQAYEAALDHADSANEEIIQKAYDQIIAQWLAQKD